MAAVNASVSTKVPALIVAEGVVDGMAVEEDGAAGGAAEASCPPHPLPATTTTASAADIERSLDFWFLMVHPDKEPCKPPAIG
jgi:hypothetical protein